MATIANFGGEIEHFDMDADKSSLAARWLEWKSSASYMIKAKGITTPAQKEATLLHTAGRKLQKVYETLPEPTGLPDDANVFDKAIAKLDHYFAGNVNQPFERHKFRSMRQESSESIAHFVSRLRRQADFCGFGDTRNTHVRDQLIEGCLSPKLRLKLLEKGNELSLDVALQMSSCYEAVTQQANEMQADNVNKIDVKFSRNRAKMADRPRDTTHHRQPNKKEKERKCWKCGREGHLSKDYCCPAKKEKCRKCGRIGHFAKVCRSKDSQQSKVFSLENKESPDDEIFAINLTPEEEPEVKVIVGGQEVHVLIDSGASCNVIDHQLWRQLQTNGIICRSQSENKSLRSYATANKVKVETKFWSTVELGGKSLTDVEFLVITDKGRPILGRKTAMELGVLEIKLPESEVNLVESEFPELFSDKVGKLTNYSVELHLKPDAKFVAQPCRRVPYSLRDKVEKKLMELEDMDIIEKVEGPTPCVSPIVVVPKQNGDIRICVDMRMANTAIERSRHPIPTIDDVLSELSGNTVFTKLDLTMGFHQLELKEGISREVTTFTTHAGLFRYKRLMFGICSAPELYQHVINQVLHGAGCVGCQNISDDIVVYGKDVAEHDERLKKVLHTLKERGLTLNKKKCVFRMNEIEFMGHLLSEKGIGPTESRVKALQEAREPKDSSEVRSFLGLVNFSARYISNLSTKAEPLRRLTQKNTPFVWGRDQKKAFTDLKNSLTDVDTLAYFNPAMKTRVIADASPVGLGAVLLQEHEKGVWKTVCYASKSLSDVERRYSQTEKEALALVWSVERFQVYLLGREFELVTDHKPLEIIYSPKSKPSARIERWVLRLQPYHFNVVYKPGKENIADTLSRLPHRSEGKDFDDTVNYVNFITVKAVPKAMTAAEIEKVALNDKEMEQLRQAIQTGRWEGTGCSEYLHVANELCVVGGIVMRGTRMLIPKSLRATVLTIGHEGHLGVVSMKQRLRTKVWWPKMEKDVEKFVKLCDACQLVSRPDPPEPLASTELPEGPWRAVAIDYLGPLPSGENILVAVDYYSRYYETAVVRTITSEKTIECLEAIFARHGLPEVIVSDNGPNLVSEKFEAYMTENGIKHRRVTARYAQANGEVERQNRSILKRLQLAQAEGKDWRRELVRYMAAYRTTPHQTTGQTPAFLLMGRHPRTKLPELSQPVLGDEETRDRDQLMKFKSKQYADAARNAKMSEVEQGDLVLMKQDKKNKLTTTFEPHLYKVKNKKGNQVVVSDSDNPARVLYRNTTQVKRYQSADEQPNNLSAKQEEDVTPTSIENDTADNSGSTDTQTEDVSRRYPQRIRKAPDRLNL